RRRDEQADPGRRRQHLTAGSPPRTPVPEGRSVSMETETLHRGRLIDHIQLVVRDLPASRRFYEAVFNVLGVPMGGAGDDYLWADELFVSTASSPAAQGQLTGRHPLAFPARDRETVDAFRAAALAKGGKSRAAPEERTYHPGHYAALAL